MKVSQALPAPVRAPAWQIACLILCALAPFLNGLTNDFTYDDKIIIRDNPRLGSPSVASSVFTTHYFGGSLATGQNYRPVILLTYAMEQWIHGNRAWAFRAVNIALHVIVTLLAFSWLRRLGFSGGVAFAATLWFGAAAIHVEAVTSLVGRAEVLAALFVLLAAWLWLEASPSEGDVRPWPYSLSLVAFLTGVFVKESAIVVPGVVLLGEFFRDGRAQSSLGLTLSAVRRRAPWLAGFLLPVFVVFGVRLIVLEGFLLSRHAGIFEVENPLVGLSSPIRAVNGLWLLGRYVWAALFPVDLAADHSAYSLRPLGAHAPFLVVLTVGTALALLAAAFFLRQRAQGFSFGALFFAGTFLPASNILFPIGTIYAERLAYLPSLGPFLAVVALLQPRDWAVPRPSRIRWREMALAAVVLANVGLAIGRNRAWKNDTTLFEDMVARRPDSAKARYNLAYDLYRRRQLAEARGHLERAVAIFPRHYDAFTLLGRIEQDEGNLEEAIRSYRAAAGIFPNYERVVLALALALEEASRFQEAEVVLRAGASSLPASPGVALAEARLLEKRGEWSRAVHAWKRARILDGGSAASRMGLARALRRVGQPVASREEIRWVLYEDPSKIDARLLLAEIYEEEGKPLPACVELIRAVRSNPSDHGLAERLQEFLDRHPEYLERASRALAGPRYFSK